MSTGCRASSGMFHLPPDDLTIFAQRFEHKERDLSWSITTTYLYLVRNQENESNVSAPTPTRPTKDCDKQNCNSAALNSYSKTTCDVLSVIVIYLRADKSYTIYLKLLSRFPNSQITAT